VGLIPGRESFLTGFINIGVHMRFEKAGREAFRPPAQGNTGGRRGRRGRRRRVPSSSASDREGQKAASFLSFDAQQNDALAVLLSGGECFTHFGRVRDQFAANLQNDVARL